MALPYNPQDWYWIVGGDASAVYSSAAGDYVQPDNAAYVAWLASGGAPSPIATEAELGDVLADYQLRPTPADMLDGYKDKHSRKITIEVVAKLLFAMANEIQSLKGKPALTAQQFRQYVKGLM